MKVISNWFFVSVIFLTGINANAQVTIAPTNLFIDSNNPFGTYMVINGSNDTQEIGIEFIFAYSQMDENGNRRIVQDDQDIEDLYSIADEVRAFPRNFTLAPGQRQVVRLRLSPPNDLNDGTYWARIKTSSTPETPPLELQSNSEVAARVGISVEQVTGLFYKKGEVTTNIEINNINASLDRESQVLTVLTDITRGGNSPFLGSITVSLLDRRGIELKRGFISTSIYFDGVHKQVLDLNDVPSGNYTVSVKFESQRSDVSAQDIVSMDTVVDSISFIKR